MMFEQLREDKYLRWLIWDNAGIRCYRGSTPADILKVFEMMNREYRKMLPQDIITILDGRAPDDK